jgi:hypothetical protein
MKKAPEICPLCGETLPPRALACPECGADHRSGWREGAGSYDGLDLPDAEFDYKEFVAQEFGGTKKPSGVRLTWWISGIVLLIAFVLFYLLGPR